MDAQVLTVSSKGQISIPVEMRRELAIGIGSKLAIYTNGSTIMLKPITLPTAEELESEINQNLKDQYGMTDEDIYVEKFVKAFRQKKREQA